MSDEVNAECRKEARGEWKARFRMENNKELGAVDGKLLGGKITRVAIPLLIFTAGERLGQWL